MKRIAFFTSELSHRMGKHMGGLGNVALEMLNYLSTVPDVQLYVFSLSGEKMSKVSIVVENNITYHWFSESMFGKLENSDFNSFMQKFNTYLYKYVKDQYLTADPNFFQLAHFHDWMVIRVLLNLKMPGTTLPTIMHLHSSEFGRNGNKMLYDDVQSMERHNLEMAGSHCSNLIIAVSETFKKEIIQNFLIPPDKIHVVYNGMSYTEWLQTHSLVDARRSIGINDTDPVILFCGRLVWQKNPKILMDAFLKVIKVIPNCKLVFLGSGHMKNELEKISKDNNIWQKNVHFLGSVFGSRKIEWFKSSTLLVVPSFNEPFGLIVLEALISSIPVVIPTNISAAEFLKDGVHSIHFEPNVEHLSQILIQSLKNTDKLVTIGKSGHKHVLSKFTDIEMGKNLFEQYVLMMGNADADFIKKELADDFMLY